MSNLKMGSSTPIERSSIITNVINDYIYSSRAWRVDGRRKATKRAFEIGLSKEQICAMRLKHIGRQSRIQDKIVTHADRVKFLTAMHGLTFDLHVESSRYNRTGIDWKAYHRPTTNGKGWVLIAPDEPANNLYFEDPILTRFLIKKYCPQIHPTTESQRIGWGLRS